MSFFGTMTMELGLGPMLAISDDCLLRIVGIVCISVLFTLFARGWTECDNAKAPRRAPKTPKPTPPPPPPPKR